MSNCSDNTYLYYSGAINVSTLIKSKELGECHVNNKGSLLMHISF